VAAILATRVRLHEDKIRAAFDIFDRDGTGFITAETLLDIFAERGVARTTNGGSRWDSKSSHASWLVKSESVISPRTNPTTPKTESMSRAEAEQWIQEVDYKGNGVVDYDEFLAALMGKHVWAAPLCGEDMPSVVVYGTCVNSRPRGMSDSVMQHGMPSAISYVGANDPDEEVKERALSSSLGANETFLKLRDSTFPVDEYYFG